MMPELHELARQVVEAAEGQSRFVVALAGPPGAGKSYRSERLREAIDESLPGQSAVVPMDGYHFDNAVLEPDDQVSVKGAPHTFDVDGLRVGLERIRRADRPVAVPVFDRPLDLARAGGRLITLEHRVVIVEGNYLLLDQAPWTELHPLFDLTVMLDVADDVLEQRLFDRWLDMGQDAAGALEKARHKDMPNARLVKTHSITPDLVWR
ncbi:nucleoside/nucleotide kinase family protein [Halomonas ramblicola]|uniref:nucleoside/nucleotide kinase family protein n=1 Tax=Halomonas ramblicola TaxID=747349 RepID=UPI0025B396BE|nr:nucleoside/nucleotide kinase family protein [Halomonas ramblicola]MDN3522573.1 nucleoside/nucleotide kinase family protein [Halomonas ramblicola]